MKERKHIFSIISHQNATANIRGFPQTIPILVSKSMINSEILEEVTSVIHCV